jgi:hypothetical protein
MALLMFDMYYLRSDVDIQIADRQNVCRQNGRKSLLHLTPPDSPPHPGVGDNQHKLG